MAEETLIDSETLANRLLDQGRSDLYGELPKNNEWLQQAFLLKAGSLGAIDKVNLGFASADLKYFTTELGGHHVMNPPYQFCPSCDNRSGGFLNKDYKWHITDSIIHGMGVDYSRMIDDNMQIVHFRFGVTEFNSLMQFFTGFYDSGAALLARTGRASESLITKTLRLVGNAVALLVAPLMLVPWAVMMAGKAARYFLRWPANKFCYLKPAMPLYWTMVSNMVNSFLTYNGTINYMSPDQTRQIIGTEMGRDVKTMSVLAEMIPEMTTNGFIDMYKVSTKAKRLSMRHEIALRSYYEQATAAGDGSNWFGVARKALDDKHREQIENPSPTEPRALSLEAYVLRWMKSSTLAGTSSGQSTGSAQSTEASGEQTIRHSEKSLRVNKNGTGKDEQGNPKQYEPQEADAGFWDFLLAEEAEGSGWLSLVVNYTGAYNDSWSNTVTDNTLAQSINSTSQSAANLRINAADGNIDNAGIMQMVTDGVKAVMTGVSEVFQMEGVAALAGSAFVDIPKHWQDSTASAPRANYSMDLILPYNDQVSRAMGIFIPISCVMCGGMPLKAGPQAYTSPLYCEVYDRGRFMSRYAMITNISLERGASNQGYTTNGHSLGFKLSFEVTDMSSVQAISISPGLGIMNSMFDAEDLHTDWVMALSGMKLKDLVNRIPMMMYQFNRTRANIDSLLSPAHFAQYVGSLPGFRTLQAIARGTDRQ